MKKNKKQKKAKINKKFFLQKIFLFLLFLFLFLNIYYSQNISPIYLGLINKNQKAVLSFLSSIKKTSFFEEELKKTVQIFGEPIKVLIFAEDNAIDQQIKNYQSLLLKNPNSRDLLYNLSLLYEKKGDEKKAKEYLKKAKEIDPAIK